MSSKSWIGSAPLIAMVETLTVGGTPQLPAPAAPTVSNVGTGGTVAAGVYQVEVTYVNAVGETVASASSSTTTTGSTSTITINSPAASGNATGWYAYVTQAGGSTYTRQQAAGSPTAIGTNLTLTAPPTSTGANPPAVNTAAGMTYTVAMGLNNTKTVSYTSTPNDTNATVATNFQASLATSLYPEFQEETWANPSPLPAPAAPTVSNVGTGGTVAAGVYQVEVTYVNAVGETVASASSSTTTSGTTSTITVNSPAASGNATGWYAYVTQAGGSTYTRQQAAGSPTAIGTNLTLTAPPTSTGANPPASDTSVSGLITATANTPGMPFTLTTSATGTGTLAASTTTANSGPNDVSLAANYSTNALPVNGDDLYITGTSVSLLYNLSALSAVTLNSLNWDTTFTGQAGLPAQNANGYAEYRPLNFQIGATTENFLPGTGGGSGMIRRDNGAVAWTVNVNALGTPAIQGRPALLLKGSNAANALNVTLGNVGSAIDPGDTATWATVNMGYQQSPLTDVTLTLGSGCTLSGCTIDQDGGTLSVSANLSALVQRGGTSTLYGSATVGTLDVEGGTCYYQSSGTATTVTSDINGTIDCTRDPRGRAFTNCTVYGALLDPNHTVTHTNPPNFPNGIVSPSNRNGATLDWGSNFHLARS